MENENKYIIVDFTKRRKLMIFSTGRFYSIIDDVVSEIEIKKDVFIDKKTLKIYRFSYFYFQYRKFNPAKLIATYFVTNPNEFKKIVRKDNNVLNNYYTNLEWVRDNKSFKQKQVSKILLKNLSYETLSDYNKIIYQFVIENREEDLYNFIYKGKFRRYLYKSYYDRGLPDCRFELFLDKGYDILKERLKKYYSFKYNTDYQSRKYIFTTMYLSALSFNRNEPLLKLSFVPKELRNKYQEMEESYLEEIFCED
ncbi:hypothetical protein [Chryseobacterium oncorhynchi]|uniref:Uncharacterized protein n=1 Tax=Chryseobacterium oncorhynchi TaxID=741074 RepID=A0A316WCK5_9FLAO|nr:hypothetical protein [Chryseobacterium oncorhynchi]PWN59162.1 hypothetical protein C1638_021945 [Chryseobacterium oncorhynchi]